MKSGIKKGIIGLFLGGAVVASGAVTDAQINPYTEDAQKYELPVTQDLPESGNGKVELSKAEPKVNFSKWNGEVNMGVKYNDITAIGDRAFLSDKVEWKSDTEEMHAYPIDGGFEIEVVLNEKPTTNKFDFQIDGAEELDFLYQPALDKEYPNQGCTPIECVSKDKVLRRPENVIGSYAVYHKTKKDLIKGQINYGTGKAYHIYRPKAIDANGKEQWSELKYSDGVLSVTVPQEFLDNATYPVIVDPTLGYTTIGGSSEAGWSGYIGYGRVGTAVENGTVTALSVYHDDNAPTPLMKVSLYSQNGTSNGPGAKIFGQETGQSAGTSAGWFTDSGASGSLTASTVYWMGFKTDDNNLSTYYDSDASYLGLYESGHPFAEAWPDPSTFTTASTRRWSFYVTYTASGGSTSTGGDGTGWFQILQ